MSASPCEARVGRRGRRSGRPDTARKHSLDGVRPRKVGTRRVGEGSRERGMRGRIRRAGIVLRLANRRVTPAAAHVDGIRRSAWASAWAANRIHGDPVRESGVGAGGFGRQSARRLWRHPFGGVAGCSPRRVACSDRLRSVSSERAAACELRTPGVVCRFGDMLPAPSWWGVYAVGPGRRFGVGS